MEAVDHTGQVVNGYRLEACLGRGAMGAVYRARHEKLNRFAAIKVIHAHLIKSEALLERFQAEARVTAKLRHPNVVPVLDVSELPDGSPAMTLEFVNGTSLATLVGTPMVERRAVDLVRQICRGLYHAHMLGLVHRDMKPDNVMIERDDFDREVPRIIDFGISLFRDPDDSRIELNKRLTEENLVVGTPAYMAPEQALAMNVSRRLDQFAVGILLFELLAGMLPFDGGNVTIATANVACELPRIAQRAPDVVVDPLLEGILRKMTAKRPGNRFDSMAEVIQAFDMLDEDRQILAEKLGLPVPKSRVRQTTMPLPIESFLSFDDD